MMKMKHLLWCVFFLKMYATEDVSAARMGYDCNTFQKWVWKYIECISFLTPFYLSFQQQKMLSPDIFILLLFSFAPS